MDNRDNWEYNATFTVRVKKETKDRLWNEAAAKGICFSDYIRSLLNEVPNDQRKPPPQSARERLEWQIKSSSRK